MSRCTTPARRAASSRARDLADQLGHARNGQVFARKISAVLALQPFHHQNGTLEVSPTSSTAHVQCIERSRNPRFAQKALDLQGSR
jgi:hypothetical protein